MDGRLWRGSALVERRKEDGRDALRLHEYLDERVSVGPEHALRSGLERGERLRGNLGKWELSHRL